MNQPWIRKPSRETKITAKLKVKMKTEMKPIIANKTNKDENAYLKIDWR